MEAITFHDSAFERDIREALGKENGPVTIEDLLSIHELSCEIYNNHNIEDLETVCKCRNLEELYIELWGCDTDFQFLSSFPSLKELYVISGCDVDFCSFTVLPKLTKLVVSGGDWSHIDYCNMDALIQMPNLTSLTLHEFGTVDLSFLKGMPWLTEFFCGWAKHVYNVDSIGSLKNLDHLTLIMIEMDNLDFLNKLPDSLSLELSGSEVHDGFNENMFLRFQEADVYDMTINQQLSDIEVSISPPKET